MKTFIPIRPFLIALILALVPKTQAVSPPPDGGYAGFNTAEGQNALFNLTTGTGNTAVGWYSLFADSTNNFNTAVGAGALVLNTADNNTAVGTVALLLNTTGVENTAVGSTALLNNTTGIHNTANGAFALTSNTTGTGNTANGHNALSANMTGSQNTADGGGALSANTADSNTAVGHHALLNNTTGASNIALGEEAGTSQTTGSNNIYIGDTGVASESNTIAIGRSPASGTSYGFCYVGAVYGVATVSGTTLPVIVSDQGQLGTAPSAARFKKEIKTMGKASESVFALKPVTFHYKSDKTHTPQFGLVAEDVAEVNPDLVVRDKEGKPYTVRYDAVNAMLLNEFLKEHRKVEEQGAIIAKQQNQIEALAAGLRKVSAQVELNRTAPQMVANKQ